jgi:pimeloyl-ACP methyl ester carboxylesterase
VTNPTPSPTATPKTDRTMKLGDGRTLAFCDWGDLQGRPVVLFHGMPGSRLFCPDHDATEASGVRLITIDRPGYGRSDPSPGRTLLDWVDDFVELAQFLHLPPCPVMGWSSGGPYALACAARAPEGVTDVGLAAAVGPYDLVPGALDEAPSDVRSLMRLLRHDPGAAAEFIENRCGWYADDPDAIFAHVGGHDDFEDRLMSRPEVMEPLKVWIREGARQGSAGYVQDWIAERSPWGFAVGDVERPVHVWWGETDRLVGRVHTDYLAREIPRAALVTYPGEGHLFPLNHWGEMLAALL